ncbi:hypothetical protein [Bacillus sp. 03113]|uniref:hypothetical protein n=1 Tax=Bacillus sp. 03113 TaxID=2578211 RepID=UPI0011427482|nr:hypothetical protein [Bacillus sp. 03113]
MAELYLYKYKAEELIHVMQVALSTHLPDQVRSDIYRMLYEAVTEENKQAIYWRNVWEERYDKLIDRDYVRKWNELRLKLGRMDDAVKTDDVLELMLKLDRSESIR